MQLNEIIEENSLPTISKRTRIPLEYLEAIIEQDWSKMNKVQALGFISILEREYQADLSDFATDCRAYFSHIASEEEEEAPLIITPIESDTKKKIIQVSIIALLLLTAYEGWSYLSVPEKTDNNITTLEKDTAKDKGFFGSVNGVFSKDKGVANATKSNQDEPPLASGAWKSKSQEKNNSKNKKESSKKDSKNSSSDSQNDSSTLKVAKEETKIIKQVKKEQARAEKLRQQTVQDSGNSPEETNLSNLSGMILAATTTNSNNSKNEANNKQEKPLAPIVPSVDNKNENSTQTPQESTQESTQNTKVLFHPRSKVWIGYTNLKTMKRVAEVDTKDITFDTSKGDYILATGHGNIEFNAKNPLRLHDGHKHFFKIANGEVQEISHEEFQKLNRSKVW